MSTIDRQRIAAVKTLEAMGYTFGGDKWLGTQLVDRRKLTPCTRCSSTARISWEAASKARRRSRSIHPSSVPSLLMSRGVGPMARPRAAKASCLARSNSAVCRSRMATCLPVPAQCRGLDPHHHPKWGCETYSRASHARLCLSICFSRTALSPLRSRWT